MIDMDVTGGANLLANLSALAGIDGSPKLRQALLGSADDVAAGARDNLDEMVYAKPLPAGADRTGGLKEKTRPLGNFRVKADKVITTVGTEDFRAPFVHFGTGPQGKAKGGREEPWVFQDAGGEFHTTVGQEPKPYLTKALKDEKQGCMEKLMQAIMTIPKP